MASAQTAKVVSRMVQLREVTRRRGTSRVTKKDGRKWKRCEKPFIKGFSALKISILKLRIVILGKRTTGRRPFKNVISQNEKLEFEDGVGRGANIQKLDFSK